MNVFTINCCKSSCNKSNMLEPHDFTIVFMTIWKSVLIDLRHLSKGVRILEFPSDCVVSSDLEDLENLEILGNIGVCLNSQEKIREFVRKYSIVDRSLDVNCFSNVRYLEFRSELHRATEYVFVEGKL